MHYETYEYKSHNPEDIIIAIDSGEKIWLFKTDDENSQNENDILIGEQEECYANLKDCFDYQELPDEWTFRQIEGEELKELRSLMEDMIF